MTDEAPRRGRPPTVSRSFEMIDDTEPSSAPIGDPPPEQEKPEEPAEDARAELRERLLAGLDEETRALISDEDLAAIMEEESKKALAERRKNALRLMRDRAQLEALIFNDLIPADVLRSQAEQRRLNEDVKIRVNLPDGGAGTSGEHGFRVNGHIFRQGETFTVKRHVYNSLLEQHFRAWYHELQFSLLNQHKPGQSAIEMLQRTIPQLEVMH